MSVNLEITDGMAPDWADDSAQTRSEAAITWLRFQGLLTLDEASKARSRLRNGMVQRPRRPSAFDEPPGERFEPFSDGRIEPTQPRRLAKNRQHRQHHPAQGAEPAPPKIKPPWEW